MRGPTIGTAASLLLVLACFSLNSLFTRHLVSRDLLDPASVTVARFASGAVMLAVLLALQGKPRAALPRRSDALPAAFLGAYALLIAYGYRFIGAAAGTFVFYACVVATMALGSRRFEARAVAGAALGLAGVAVLAYGRVEGTTPLGVLLLAGTGAAWGGYSLLLRARGDALGTNARAFVGVALGLPFLAVAASASGDVTLTVRGALLGVFMGAVTTALAYALWARVLPRVGAAQAGAYQLLVPVLTAAGGVLALGEPFGVQLAVAGAFVVSGMALARA